MIETEPTGGSLESRTSAELSTGDVARPQRAGEVYSTYRVQLHRGFRFADATAILEYLRHLGISALYASPYLKARAGSTHGYDISDHRLLNPEIGTREELTELFDALERHGMWQLIDVVPNHMGIVGNENHWWNDVLQHGPASRYATFFDIDWYSALKPELHEKVLLPLLGGSYGEVLESGALKVSYANGAFELGYFDHRFPLSPCTWDVVLQPAASALESGAAAAAATVELQSIMTAIRNLPRRNETAPEKIAERARESEVIRRRLSGLVQEDSTVHDAVERALSTLNGTPGVPESFDQLDQLLTAQAYRLSYFRVASDEVNYRRFFDINELAAVSMERDEVFAETHALLFELLRSGRIAGVRIDHPDGLYDPRRYFEKLQGAWREEGSSGANPELVAPNPDGTRPDDARPALYILVEKIVAKGEKLPESWPVAGTTGYDALNAIGQLFVDSAAAKAFQRLYHRWTGLTQPFEEVVYQKKRLILETSLAAELHVLAQQLDRISERYRHSRDFTLNAQRDALREIIACFPVYRSYIDDRGVSDADRQYILTAISRARRRNPAMVPGVFEFIRAVLLQTLAEKHPLLRDELRRFAGKFQQVTAPVTAKGVEDTAFYVYVPLLSLNEVGGYPDQFGSSIPAFHRQMEERAAKYPLALTATATHDTKRGEDTRARLNVLSEIPDEWRKALARWEKVNRKHRLEIDGELIPDRNTEYLIYQTLVGCWPLEGLPHEEARKEYLERVVAYTQKAIHEAKVHTSWVSPNTSYDEAVGSFVEKILSVEGGSNRFLDDLVQFVNRIAPHGLYNSLSQTLLKLTVPGVPDIYQGTELWDFTLVDPDNRRPVDYERRREMLAALDAEAESPEKCARLLSELHTAALKLYLIEKALSLRNQLPEVFLRGGYQSMAVAGQLSDLLIAFTRGPNAEVVIVAPRFTTRLASPTGEVWGDTRIELPASYRNVLTGERHDAGTRRVGELCRVLPFALLCRESVSS